MESGIYRIKNIVTEMVYIGQAYSFNRRWKNHKIELNLNRHCNPYLQSAWNKYGSYNFDFYILERCEPIKELLKEREQFWMDKYKSYNRILGYNLQSVAGGSMLGVKASAETKALLSSIKIGKSIHTEESKAKIGEASSKRIFSAESRDKMRQSQLGKKQSKATKAKRSVIMSGNQNAAGKPRSPEHLAAMFEGRMKKKREREKWC